MYLYPIVTHLALQHFILSKYFMAIKKSELYSTIWESCNQLRGGMDASQYEDYVLAMLFIKYVSDKYAGVSNWSK